MSRQYEVTAIISTYNRSGLLPEALESLLRQDGGVEDYEVIVVDNNSTDSTSEVVEGYIAAGHSNLRYVFEPNQGSSFARNAGVNAARSDIIAFADDDVVVAKDWIATIKRTFESHPGFDCIGGRVLPRWRTPVPGWLTREHWMPLALQDYGDRPLAISSSNRLCLVSANLAFRREAFIDAGWFAPELQRIKDGIGSMEDAELLERYWRTGRQALYLPELLVEAEVTPERTAKAYHRRWHRGHGYFFAIKRWDQINESSIRLFDVPAHLYRRALIDATSCLFLMFGNRSRAFAYETRLHFFRGFFHKRREDYLATDYRGMVVELSNFVRSCAFRKSTTETQTAIAVPSPNCERDELV